jgi:hypothetical protein
MSVMAAVDRSKVRAARVGVTAIAVTVISTIAPRINDCVQNDGVIGMRSSLAEG